MRFLILLPLLLLLSCSSSKEIVKADADNELPFKYDESFDPLTLNDDDIIIAGKNSGNDNTEQNKTDSDQQNQLKEINGFRVQILATKNLETASLFEQEAAERFQNNDQETYLLFETPLYKIRVGNCKHRSDAEYLRDLAIQHGYREAFIVPSKIQIYE